MTTAASSHAPLALAAVATAGVLVYAVWAERRRRAELAALQAQLSSWRGQLTALKEQIDVQCKQIAAVWKSHAVVFTVCQYNILASYLGDNKQPWFLYGCPDMNEGLRERITAKFYERGPDGKFCNLGWPKYAIGLLTDEQQRLVEEEHERHFAWEARRERLLQTVRETNSDLISLVELDRYEEFWKPEMEKLGFDSAYRKRPRKASADGCGIFWRRHLFELIDQDHLEFVDRMDPETGRTSKDRCALFVLLRHVHSSERMIFISTHLARNPEDCTQTKMRAKQAAALFQKLTPFAAHHDALDAPVILAGDLNTTNIRQLGNIARAVLELCDQPVHPFVFSAMATRSLPTSVTSTRRMRIDYLLHSTAVQMVDAPNMPALASPIPDDEHPSDHIPLVIKVRIKSELSQLHEMARGWVLMVLADGSSGDYAGPAVPLSSEELDKAFAFFDVDADGLGITEGELAAGMRELSFEQRTPQLLTVLRRELQDAMFSGQLAFKRQADGTWDVLPLQRAAFRRVYVVCFERMKGTFRNEMYEAFSYFDSDRSGTLTHDELLATFRAACPFDLPVADFERIWQQLDSDNDGQITLDEFVDSIIHRQYHANEDQASFSARKAGVSMAVPKGKDTRRDNLRLLASKSRGYEPTLSATSEQPSDKASEKPKPPPVEVQPMSWRGRSSELASP